MAELLETYEMLSYYQSAVAVRCFIYPEFLRCGALWLGPRMPPLLPFRDQSNNAIAMVEIPEEFRGLGRETLLGDGHPIRFNANPRMIQLAIKEIV